MCRRRFVCFHAYYMYKVKCQPVSRRIVVRSGTVPVVVVVVDYTLAYYDLVAALNTMD